MVQALDTSGSMSGSPIEALKLGALAIGKEYYEAESRPFEKFITMDYNSSCKVLECDTHERYKTEIDRIRAGGGTYFNKVFEKLEKVLD